MMGRTPVPYITGGVGNDAGENDSGQKTSLPPASHAESPGGSGERLRSLGGGSSLELRTGRRALPDAWVTGRGLDTGLLLVLPLPTNDLSAAGA